VPGDVIAMEMEPTREPRFVLTLIKRARQDVELVACEISNRAFTNRTVFSEGALLNDVLDPVIADEVERHLPDHEQSSAMFSYPNFMVELPNLMLGCVSVIISHAVDGAQKISFRFKRFFGNISDAFRPEIGFDTGFTDVISSVTNAADEFLDSVPLRDLEQVSLDETRSVDPARSYARSYAQSEVQSNARSLGRDAPSAVEDRLARGLRMRFDDVAGKLNTIRELIGVRHL
jgi:hypothetical protein